MFGGAWNALARCRPAGPLMVVSGWLWARVTCIPIVPSLNNITPTSSVLHRGINRPAVIVPPTPFLSYSDRYANPSVHINAQHMPEGVSWEGHSHLVHMGPGVSRQVDKQSDSTAASQTTGWGSAKTPKAKCTGRSLSYSRLTIVLRLHKSIFECDHAYACVRTHTYSHLYTSYSCLTSHLEKSAKPVMFPWDGLWRIWRSDFQAG